ncbi:MAG: hypothetical protein AB7K24_18000 [Gemmataceae bacterium]
MRMTKSTGLLATLVLGLAALGWGYTTSADEPRKEGEGDKVQKKDQPRDGDREKPAGVKRDGDKPAPREGDRPGVKRDGDKPAPREGDRPGVKRDGDKPAPREGDRPVKRDGDRPRDGAGRGEEGGHRETVVVVPISKMPGDDVLGAMEKVFGKNLKLMADAELKVIVLQGRASLVDAAVLALGDSIDRTRNQRGGEERGDNDGDGFSVVVVTLRNNKTAAIAGAIKKFLPNAVDVTERSSVPALILEGKRAAVEQAAQLARQLDGQQLHPSVARLLGGERGE